MIKTIKKKREKTIRFLIWFIINVANINVTNIGEHIWMIVQITSDNLLMTHGDIGSEFKNKTFPKSAV